MNTRRMLFAAVFFLSLTVGCSSGNSSAKSATITTPPSAQTSAGTATSPSDDLEATLLAVTDLPTGFSVETTTDDNDDNDDICGTHVPKAPVHVDADFAKDSLGPFITEQVSRYDSATDARAALTIGADAFQTCHTDTGSDGTKLTFGALSFPALGDRSLAIHFTADTSAADAEGNIVYVVKGSLLMTLGTYAAFTSTPDLLERLAPKAVAKLS